MEFILDFILHIDQYMINIVQITILGHMLSYSSLYFAKPGL